MADDTGTTGKKKRRKEKGNSLKNYNRQPSCIFMSNLPVVKSSAGGFKVNLSKKIATPVFCIPVSIAIAIISGRDCLKIKDTNIPKINPNHGKPMPANTI